MYISNHATGQCELFTFTVVQFTACCSQLSMFYLVHLFCDLVIATSVIQSISSHLIRMDLRNESHSCHPTCDTTELVRSCANFDIVNGNTVMGMGLGNVVKANPVPTLYPYNSVCKSLTFSFKSLL